MNSAIFSCLFIVKYFDFSASAGGFDLSLLNMHTISGTSVSNYFEILYDNLMPKYFCCRLVVSFFGGDIFKILNSIIYHTCLYIKTPTTSTARLLYISIYYSIKL